MVDLDRPVRKARRRLLLNRWMWALGWTLTGAAVLFAALVLVDRTLAPFAQPVAVLTFAAGALVVAALVAAIIWMGFTGETLSLAAARLDQAAGLKERLSSGLYCASLADSSDPFAQAVVADARRVARTITPGSHLPLRFPRSGNWAGISMVLALLVLWLFPSLDLAGIQENKQERQHQNEVVQRTEAQVRPIVQNTLDKIREENPALKDELEGLEPFQNAQLQTPLDVRREALKKVEKLSEQLESKRNRAELAKIEEFKRMLRRLETEQKGQSAVGQLAESLAKGDFKSAQAAIAALQKELSKAASSPQEQQQAEDLKKQLQQLSDKLNQLAANDRKVEEKLRDAGLSQEELRKALENLKKGDFEAVSRQLADKGLSKEQLNKVMQEVQKRCQACSMASQLASKLGSAAQSGGTQGAAQPGQGDMDALSQAGEQLSEMESLQQELKQLESAMSQLNNARNQITGACKACSGTGQMNGQSCGACQGTGMGQGSQGGPGLGRSGMGQNPGQGEGGVAPEQQTGFRTVAERTPVNTKRGSIISQQFVDGEQFKGEVSEEFREAAISAQREVTDAVAREQIPRQYQSSVKEYFTRSTRGIQPSPAPAPASSAAP
ncbi:MAG TPA: hypothetical protein VLM89_06770 [Phycisphaerae bacterium]|nr:hypothetical protein [Phycisphaerae bacterium]